MEKPISVGDLVEVIRVAPCGCDLSLGNIFRVSTIRKSLSDFSCAYCAAKRPTATIVEREIGVIELNRLKRIPPLSELEGADSWEELNTPVLL